LEAIEQRVARHDEQIKTLFGCAERVKTRLEKHESEDGVVVNKIMDEIKAIRADYANRLPVWTTLLLGVLMAALGWLAKG